MYVQLMVGFYAYVIDR